MIYIDTDRCVGCGSCVDVCPTGALSLVGIIARIEPALCDACLACLDECREGAIQAGVAVPVHSATPVSADVVSALTEAFHLEEAIPMLHDDIHEAASGEHGGYGRGHGRGRRRDCRHSDGEGHAHGHGEGHGHGHGEGRGHGHGQGYRGGRGRQRCRERSRLRERDAEKTDRDAEPETDGTTLEREIARLKAQAQQLQEALADVSSRLAALERE